MRIGRSIYTKFIVIYIVLAALLLTVTMTLGSYLIERHEIRQVSRAMYEEAYQIATGRAGNYFTSDASLDDLYASLRLTATFSGARIRILNAQGQILLDSSDGVSQDNPVAIASFNAASFGPQYYEVSDFFGEFDEQMLNVMLPVSSGMTVRGYVSMHRPMQNVLAGRDDLLKIVLVIAAIFYALSFLILFLFTVTVYRPLSSITEGALEYASGNLQHRVELPQSDEIGYLADSMNLMAQELERSNEYQRQFVANVSHDFRSPLTSIKGFTEAMVDGTIPPEMHEKYLRIIGEEAERLENLTQGILQMNSAEISEALLRRTDFDINGVIRNTAALFEGSCREKRIAIDLVLSGEVLMVNADEERIKQVLYNLLDNAIKFSKNDSAVKIETDEKHDKCYVSVKDNGMGISKADLPRIWNRFYKADVSRGKDRRGSGLGLSIVKEIIRAHGQNINVMSTEGVGTEFIFTLALSEEEE